VLRRALIAAIAALALAPARAHADDKLPVWLGITYTSAGPGAGVVVTEVHEETGAAAAGLKAGDQIIELGGVVAPPDLKTVIAPLKVGDHLKITILRAGRPLVLDAVMMPRVSDSEIMQRRLVDKPAPDFEIALPSAGIVDLASMRGKVGVLALFPPGCDGCAAVVSSLGAWSQRHARDPVVVVGATPMREPAGLASYLARNPIVIPVGAMPAPLDATTPSPYFAESTHDAVTFVVIDGKGVVRLASVIEPSAAAGSDDAVEDVCVAAERALKSLKRR
jgi:PDZ domain